MVEFACNSLCRPSFSTFGAEFIAVYRFPLYLSECIFVPPFSLSRSRMYETSLSIAPPMLMACTGRNAAVICQSPAGKFASFDVRGGWKRWNISVTMGAQSGARYLCQILLLLSRELVASLSVSSPYLCTVPTSL